MTPRKIVLSGARAAALATALVLASCATFRPEEGRVSEINKSAGGYAQQAILLNIVRAEHYEPLSFVTVTGLDGTNSVTGSLGFGGFTLGPHLHASPRSFLLGPDSVMRSGSNTFHVSVVDDPASFVALLSPLTPASIAFFKNQGYPRELLFFLLVDHLRVVAPDGRGGATAETLQNDPSDPIAFARFAGTMASLLKSGLVAEIDASAVPTGRGLPRSAFCFDASLPTPAFAGAAGQDTTALSVRAAGTRPIAPPAQSITEPPCQGAQWVEAVSATGGGGGGTAAPAAIVPGGDGSLWMLSEDRNEVQRLTPGKPTEVFAIPKRAPKPPAPVLLGFPVTAPTGERYEIYTRSVYGVYAYLGRLRRGFGGHPTDISNLLPPDSGHNGSILSITGSSSDCFTAVEYRGRRYCVPQDADNTKRVFDLLHQLQELSTAPSNSPTTLTVTNVP